MQIKKIMCTLKTVSSRYEEFLKPEILAKLTEVGKLFHTRTILSAKNRLRVLWLQWDLYSLYAWPLVLVTRLNSKKSEKCTSTKPKTIL